MADYKINHMTGRLYKFFTGTPSSYYDYLVNRIMDVHDDVSFNLEKKVYFARVIGDTANIAPVTSTKESEGTASRLKHVRDLQGENPSPYYKYAVKFRFTGEDESRNQIPDPAFATSIAEADTLISLHSYAIVDKNVARGLSGGLTLNNLITVREEDGIYYVASVLKGDFTPLATTEKGYIDSFSKRRPPVCLEGKVSAAGACYNKDQTKIIVGERTRNEKYLLEWTDYLILGSAFVHINQYIAQHESGKDGYEANNLGTVGVSVNTEQAFGKKLVEMTLKELRANMNDSGGILFATGKYQIIPTTLRDAMASLDIPDGTLYNKQTQDALCVYLAITKRPNLGKYLMLKSEDLVKAGNDLSFEWAFAPLLGPYGKFKRGQSIYEGDSAGNKTNPNYVKTLEKALKKQKEFNKLVVSSNEKIKNIFEKYGK